MNKLQDNAILVAFHSGLCPQERQDKEVTAEIKREKNLGDDSGGWDKNLYPKKALKAIKTKQGEARTYHERLTLPFSLSTGILPSALIPEYSAQMETFRAQLARVVEDTFLANPREWIDWAVVQHNGTFDPSLYPGCSRAADGTVTLDVDKFREEMRKSFHITLEIQPVPGSEQFSSKVAALLGTNAQAVDAKVKDAEKEGQRELLRRILAPVKHMAETLAKADPRIYATLTGNIKEICRLAPALNLAGDPVLDAMVADVSKLAQWDKDSLKTEAGKTQARAEAEAMIKRLEGYSF